ncbi:MAG: NAD(P)(+) transhydrogenase (Re/Si-specific) subunit alpha, partial [Chitinophagales bacterium]
KIAETLARADIVITTAQIPGKQAPKLITKDMIESMKNGAVIIDLASATGGNTEITRDEETVTHHGVQIVGNSSLASTMPADASKLYGKNLLNFLQLLINKENNLELNFQDDLVAGACITHDGQVLNERVKALTT